MRFSKFDMMFQIASRLPSSCSCSFVSAPLILPAQLSSTALILSCRRLMLRFIYWEISCTCLVSLDVLESSSELGEKDVDSSASFLESSEWFSLRIMLFNMFLLFCSTDYRSPRGWLIDIYDIFVELRLSIPSSKQILIFLISFSSISPSESSNSFLFNSQDDRTNSSLILSCRLTSSRIKIPICSAMSSATESRQCYVSFADASLDFDSSLSYSKISLMIMRKCGEEMTWSVRRLMSGWFI